MLLLLAAVADAGPLTRAQALGALDDRSAETRRIGAASLADRGTMEDVPRLARALRDSDPLVRALAEGALWQVWGRSGDDAIDHLLAIGSEQMSERSGEAAVETFTRIIERRPTSPRAGTSGPRCCTCSASTRSPWPTVPRS